MQNLTGLIKEGKVEIKDKAGISITNLEKQMLIREYPDRVTLLKELRLPELIETVKSWPGTPAKYGVEGILQDIETRHPKRKLVLSIEESKTFEDYLEAEPAIMEEKDGAWARVPSALPGFFIPVTEQELTLNDEITRTARYLGAKCFPDLFEQEITPDNYEFSKFKILKTRHVCGRTGAEIEVELTKKAGMTKYSSVQDYWNAEITPAIADDKITPAAKKLMLIEFMRNFSAAYSSQFNDINVQKVRSIVHALEDMLQKAIKDPETHGMKEKTSYMNLTKAKIETTDEKIKKAQSVYAKGLIENMISDWRIIEALYRHENESKFNTGEPFRARISAELVYES